MLLAGIVEDLGGADTSRSLVSHRVVAGLLASQAIPRIHLLPQVPSVMKRASLLLVPGDLVLYLACLCSQKVPRRRVRGRILSFLVLVFLRIKSLRHFTLGFLCFSPISLNYLQVPGPAVEDVWDLTLASNSVGRSPQEQLLLLGLFWHGKGRFLG